MRPVGHCAALAVSALVLCGGFAPPVSEASRVTVVRLVSLNGGLQLRVDDEVVGFELLEEITLERAIENNPAMDLADVYAQAQVAICPDPAVAVTQVKEVEQALELFGSLHVANAEAAVCAVA